MYIFNIYVLRRFGIKLPTMVDMPLNPNKTNLIYLIYMYKEHVTLNNPQTLIWHGAPST